MTTLELSIIAVGLSMDAFAVSICKGLSLRKLSLRACLLVGLYFGLFQGLMPLLGYTVGSYFADYIIAIDHWIAFFLLGVIGINMIKESRGSDCGDEGCGSGAEKPLSAKLMLPLAVATSIDALAVGVSFAFLKVNILPAVAFIGIITFSLSAAGVSIGNLFGSRFKSKAEFAGGLILIVMGIKILLDHLSLLP